MTVGLVPMLSDEQAMLVDASCRFMQDTMSMAEVRRRCDEPGGGHVADEAYRKGAAELGWFGFLADESAGGGSLSGNGVVDAAVIAAERGARLQPGPFTGHSVVIDALTSSAADPLLLEELVAGGRWANWVLDGGRTCSIRAGGGGWQLHGSLPCVQDRADHLLVDASGPDGTTTVLVDLRGPGVVARPLVGLDVTREWLTLELDAAPATIVAADAGAAGPSRRRRLAAVLTAADAVGAMHADFEQAVRYARDRTAFGRPIGSFQALKHILADTSLWLEMSKAIVLDAATALGEDAAEAGQLAHAAKAFVAERGVELAHNCFQVFGGIGYTWDHDQHLFLRRIAADAAHDGDLAWQRERVLVDATEAGGGR